MTVTTHIRNCIFLWRENRKETAVSLKIDISELIGRVKHNYTKKNSWVRNQVALLIRKIRKEKPYRIRDYSEAKLLYDSITPIDLSKIKKGSYVYKISREEPVKGKRYCEYYINQCGEEGVFQVQSFEEEYNFWYLLKHNGDSNYCGLCEERSRAYRFATNAEIKDFENRRKKYLETRKKIDKKQEELSKLYKEL